MPEGDAVRRTARRLDRALAGQALVVGDLRVPRFATVDLAGSTVIGTFVHGKHLLTRVIRRDRAVTLHSHLRMDGAWVTAPAAARPATGPAHQIRAWLVTASSQAVGLRLAQVEVLPTAEEHRLIGHLGPDVLDELFDAAHGVSLLRGTGERGLGEVLLDQTVVSGLGTMWASEVAWRARADPTAPGRMSRAGDLEVALHDVRADMLAAVTGGQADNRRQLRVYSHRVCRRCKGTIRKVAVGHGVRQRELSWCPTCQRGTP